MSECTPLALQVRALCASTLLQFLLDYPLGAQRLQGHLQFLLANTAYEHETGRLAALGLLQQAVIKFPPEVGGHAASVMCAALCTDCGALLGVGRAGCTVREARHAAPWACGNRMMVNEGA